MITNKSAKVKSQRGSRRPNIIRRAIDWCDAPGTAQEVLMIIATALLIALIGLGCFGIGLISAHLG